MTPLLAHDKQNAPHKPILSAYYANLNRPLIIWVNGVGNPACFSTKIDLQVGCLATKRVIVRDSALGLFASTLPSSEALVNHSQFFSEHLFTSEMETRLVNADEAAICTWQKELNAEIQSIERCYPELAG